MTDEAARRRAPRESSFDRVVPPDLTRLVAPRSIVLVVESGSDGEQGMEIESALLSGGFAGPYSRVQLEPKSDADAAGIPRADLALISVSAPRVARVVDACKRKACRAAIVLNGPEGDVDAAAAPWAHLADAARRNRSMAVLGPNSQGVLSLPNHLFAGTGSLLRSHDLRQGPVAVVTQSGFGHALVALGDAAGLGFNHIIATGNEAGLDVVDVVRWLIDRDDVRVVWLIAESLRRGRSLVEAGRRARRLAKPILVWKTGRSAVGRAAAASHTGAIATDERIFRAGVQAGRLIAVHGEDELIDTTRALIRPPRPSAKGVGIVTVSGGAGVALADCVADAGLPLPALAAGTVAQVRRFLPRTRPVSNPLDVTRMIARDVDAYTAVIGAVARDRRVGQVILCHGGIEGASAEGLARAVVALVSRTRKPVLVVWSPRAGRADRGFAALERAGVPRFASVHRAASVAAALCAAAAPAGRRGTGGRTGGPAEIEPPNGARIIGELETKKHLARYGIPVVPEAYLSVRNGRVVPPSKWPVAFPVAVKVDTTHIKSRDRAGLVRLGVASPTEALSVGRDLVRRSRRRGLVVHRLLVQEMVRGIEVFIGGLVDLSFGPVVAVGMGGPFVELLPPIFRLAPLSVGEAREAVAECGIAARLSPRRSIDVAEALARLSWLLTDHADWVGQVDVNPLFVTRSGVLAADATIVPVGSAHSDFARGRTSR